MTIYIYTKNPKLSEGSMDVLRQEKVRNTYLKSVGVENEFYLYILNKRIEYLP